ncbi:MAG: glycosyltransferase, partial [Rickettsiales bacterium]
MNPTVSILVPTYNRSALLKKALVSILGQSFSDYEIIVVDNCSSDDTEEIVASLRDNRIRYHKNDINIGPIGNHNIALLLSKGKYVYTFSDDDIMMPNNLESKVKILETHNNVGLVHSNISVINENNDVISEHWAYNMKVGHRLKLEPLMTGSEAYKYLYREWNFISMPSVLIRKSILDSHRLWFNNQLNYLVDYDLWIKIAKIADFYYINEALVSYRTHSNNESSALTNNIYYKELTLIKISLLSEMQIKHHDKRIK